MTKAARWNQHFINWGDYAWPVFIWEAFDPETLGDEFIFHPLSTFLIDFICHFDVWKAETSWQQMVLFLHLSFYTSFWLAAFESGFAALLAVHQAHASIQCRIVWSWGSAADEMMKCQVRWKTEKCFAPPLSRLPLKWECYKFLNDLTEESWSFLLHWIFLKNYEF